MADIKAVVEVEHPDIVLTGAVRHDSSSTVRSVSEAGTDPTSGKFFYRVQSSDLGRFEDGLRNDHTIADFERVRETRDGKAIYSVEYSDEATVLSPVISTAGGVILDMENAGGAWHLTVWLSERTNLDRLWEYARQNDIDIELLRVNEYASLGSTDAGLTDSQREALLVAVEAGYFEEPRNATLSEVAADLDISQPAASGLLRRAIKRLVVSSLLDDSEQPNRSVTHD
ncbi:helix-turn-helix domain-containing protein [Haloarcula sp. GH36]|uniref:helix-turn-helix domain-containing protein n=1 Tax=Haloarcula montana TaxID=3111776 RepID=UPI002D78B12A|nr:helix-turn-helix domain-containing protein [Haloarcula sp. GH36]